MKYRLEWSDKNLIGIPELDDQHRYFFEIANDIFALSELPAPPKEDILQKMSTLADYAFFHFDTEERMLHELSEDLYRDHLARHAKYRQEIRTFLETVRNKSADAAALADEVASFAKEYVTNHMLGAFNDHTVILELQKKKGLKRQ